MIDLAPGLAYTVTETVSPSNVAATIGSGLLEVYATPAMVALMERAAMLAVQPLLPHGVGTVGTTINVEHTRATPIGAQVQAQAVLVAADARRLEFEVLASDAKGPIGRGTHVRYIIDNDRFMNKVLDR